MDLSTSSWLVVAIVALLAGVLALVSDVVPFNPSATDKPHSDYRSTVINILSGERVEQTSPRIEAGLVPGMSTLFDAMYCPENDCTFANEMGYLFDVTQETMRMLRNGIVAPLCRTDQVSPPSALDADHREICDRLDAIYGELRSVEQNVKVARDLLARNENPSRFESTLNQLNQRILNKRTAIIDQLRAMREIAWLAPVFEGANEEIPRLSRSRQ